MQRLTIAKFGGSFIDLENFNANMIVSQVKELRAKDGLGPIIVFSAPRGYTNMLISIGESAAQSNQVNFEVIFEPYRKLAKNYVKKEYQEELLEEIHRYHEEVELTIKRFNKRFEGNNKARLLTIGGELPTSCLMDYILRSKGIDSCHILKENWPIITNDNFENAIPNYNKSKKKMDSLIKLIEQRKVICQAGFLGMTEDYLETILGRGGSDQTAVFVACLLKDSYIVSILLFKEIPVLSADPNMIKNQKLDNIKSLTYNEAIKATTTGMNIIQSASVRLAQEFRLPIQIAPINNIKLSTIIKQEDSSQDIIKCVTGIKDSAILTVNNEKSKSLEDCLRLWENYEDIIDLGTEILETGKDVRDFLVLDSNFVRKNEEKLRNFDSEIKIEYHVGVVTLIGDRMKNSPGVGSVTIGSIPNINIKRAVFAPHTSQIILVLDENDVGEAVSCIHSKRISINRSFLRKHQ